VPSVEGAGVELAYEERGGGRPLVLVHGTCLTRGAWGGVLDELDDGYRAIAYDRRGYGDSEAPEHYAGTTIGEHSDDLAALIRALDAAPALVCGHSFGAVAVLDLMVREPDLVDAAVLVEPAMLWLASGGAAESSGVRAAIEEGAQSGGPAGAVDAFLLAVCGPRALDLLGPDAMVAAHRAAISLTADLGALANWSIPPRRLREPETPAVVLAGTRTRPALREAAEILAGMLPRAELRSADSEHLVPIEAPDAVADAIRAQP
jgi:pimeloyl-ACP methyl ester carboxylesterase